jgi:hypothetical protein
MEHFTEATLKEIREKAETKPEYKLLLDFLPFGVSEDTVFYCTEYLHEDKIDILIEPVLEAIEEEFSEKYPFLKFRFRLIAGVACHEYIQCYFSNFLNVEIPEEIRKGTELEYLEYVLYKISTLNRRTVEP